MPNIDSGDWNVDYAYPHPVSAMPPWSTGRWYELCALQLGTFGTRVMVNRTIELNWGWVPQPIAITNMGIEVTSAGSGSTGRLGVYSSMSMYDPIQRLWAVAPRPGRLICQTASFALDSVAYLNAAVTFQAGWGGKLPQGVVWVASTEVATTTNPTVRTLNQNNARLEWLGADLRSKTPTTQYTFTPVAAVASNIVTNGYPLWIEGADAGGALGTPNRVLVET